MTQVLECKVFLPQQDLSSEEVSDYPKKYEVSKNEMPNFEEMYKQGQISGHIWGEGHQSPLV